jgi:hypothetical protein
VSGAWSKAQRAQASQRRGAARKTPVTCSRCGEALRENPEAGNPRPVFLIEKDVPIPEPIKGLAVRLGNYPFDDMVPGDSFFVPEEEENRARRRDRLQTCAWKYTKRHRGTRFIVRQVEGGCRVWRVS